MTATIMKNPGGAAENDPSRYPTGWDVKVIVF